ncbi:hypothetical protein EVAR_29079_1 [Eumeta japonica]|uniref:Uncharacterized protein n=1 Tax=Eumeta variegata TaxID=151549 RepID=A0A4C1VNW3_EUMVA|nr:hypothetical protein EVAR_29079_1 [Eumeta japonica]
MALVALAVTCCDSTAKNCPLVRKSDLRASCMIVRHTRLMMELEGGHRNSVIKRRNPIEFGLVFNDAKEAMILGRAISAGPGFDQVERNRFSAPPAPPLTWRLEQPLYSVYPEAGAAFYSNFNIINAKCKVTIITAT